MLQREHRIKDTLIRRNLGMIKMLSKSRNLLVLAFPFLSLLGSFSFGAFNKKFSLIMCQEGAEI